ncbi:MAG TPA: ATP synthase F1 subunit epsilon [Saprospiraceae bacterium]|nr:ATP synthase F1 subunit epsilon [Saprospiraceae bacterium]
MNTIVLTPEKELYKGRAHSVKVPGTHGQFEILKGHAPIVSSLDTGEILIKEASGNTIKFNIKGGFVEVLRNEVSLLVHQI